MYRKVEYLYLTVKIVSNSNLNNLINLTVNLKYDIE